jgi:hypothetical protein
MKHQYVKLRKCPESKLHPTRLSVVQVSLPTEWLFYSRKYRIYLTILTIICSLTTGLGCIYITASLINRIPSATVGKLFITSFGTCFSLIGLIWCVGRINCIKRRQIDWKQAYINGFIVGVLFALISTLTLCLPYSSIWYNYALFIIFLVVSHGKYIYNFLTKY